MSKRLIVILSILCLLTFSSVAFAEQVTITFWGWINPEWVATYRDFEKQYPDIKIKESLVSQEWASTSEKFLAAMAAGNAPDASIQNSHQFSQWASQAAFYDITPLAERDGMLKVEDWFEAQWRGTFFAEKQFALPGTTDTRLLYWNKNMFEEAGLDPEVPPATWEDLENFSEKLNRQDDKGRYTQYGFLPYWGNSWTWIYGWLNEGEFLDSTGTKVTCDDPRIVEALDWMVNFYDKYCGGAQVAASFIEGFQGAANDPFVNNKVAMQINGNWQLWFFATFPDLKYGTAPPPVPREGMKPTTWSCGSYYALSANTKYPEEAWTFIKWLAGPEGAKSLAKHTLEQRKKDWERQQLPGEPVYVPDLFNNKQAMEVLMDEYLPQLPPKVQEEFQLAVDALNWTHSCTEMGLVGLTYWNELDNATQSALYHKMTPEEALKICKERVQKALDEAWANVKVK